MDALNSATKLLFISYSRRQRTRSDELYRAIDEHTTYYRWRDNRIPGASDWWESICANIEGCFAFVALLSPDYIQSIHCMGELDYAVRLNKPIIALVEGLEPDDYPKVLKAKRIQFHLINELPIEKVIHHLQSACASVIEDYRKLIYSPDISMRPYLRPRDPEFPSENGTAPVVMENEPAAEQKPIVWMDDETAATLTYVGALVIDARLSDNFAGTHCDQPTFTQDVKTQLNWVFDLYGIDLDQADTVNLLTQSGLWHYNPQRRCNTLGNWPLTFQKREIGNTTFYRLYAAPHPGRIPLDDQTFEIEVNGQKIEGVSVTISW